MSGKFDDLSAAEAEAAVQQMYKRRRKCIERDPKHIWSLFEPAKVAQNELQFQIVLKCGCCTNNVSAKAPATSMPRHLGSANCNLKGQAEKTAWLKHNKALASVEEPEVVDLCPAAREWLAMMESEVDGGIGSKRKKTQANLTDNYIVQIPDAAKEEFMKNFNRWVIVRGSTLSFNVVEDPLLKAAFKTLGLPLPDRKKISGKILKEEFDRVVAARTQRLAEVDCYQLAGDSWKSHYANSGEKIMAATVALPKGGALAGGFQGIKGAQKQDADFIFDFYDDLIESLGADKCAGVVFDGEAAYQCAARKLEEKFPGMSNFHCQAHVLSLLIKDLIKADKLLEWVITGVHSIIVFINSHKDVQAELKEAQELFYEEIRALPVGVETRFATAILELASLLKNETAVIALEVVSTLRDKYDAPNSPENAKNVFSLLKNRNFWKAAKEYKDLLYPIAEVIHHVERDSACVTQLPRLWAKIKEHFVAWGQKYRALDEFMSDATYKMPDDAIAPEVGVLLTVLETRRKRGWNPVFTLARMLDLRFAVKDGNSRFKPDMSLVDEEEKEAVDMLLRRLAGDKADAAELELMEWMAEGATNPIINGIVDKAVTEDGWLLVENVARVVLTWKTKLNRQYPILCEIAKRLLVLHATSCSCERLWSLMRWIYRPNRTRLSLEKAEMMATGTFNEWLERRDWREDFTGTWDSLIESVVGMPAEEIIID